MTDRLNLLPRYREELEALLRQHVPEAEVWACGSRVNGRNHDGSDLNLVLRSPTLEPLGDEYVEFVEALGDSNIPIPVEAHDWAKLPKSLHYEIERDYVVVQRGIDQPNGIEANAWIEVPFAHLLAEPVRNGIYKKKEFHGAGAKIVNMGELFSNPRLRDVPMRRVKLSDSEQSRLDVRVGDLLFARRSLVAEGAGKCSVVLEVSEPTTFESSIIRARPDTSKADPQFLYYYFNSPPGLHALDSIRRHVAVAGITGSDLAQLEVLLPPLREQRAIAHILGALDDKIELNRRMNKTLEAMARAIFKDWFVDFGPVRAKLEGREPYLPPELRDLFPDRLVGSGLGEIPEGWEVKSLEDCFNLTMGQSPPGSTYNDHGEGLPFFQGSTDFGKRFPSNRKYCSSPNRIAEEGDTLVSVRAPVGALNMAWERCCIGRGVAALRHKWGSGAFTYYSAWAMQPEFQQYEQTGTVFGAITRKQFETLPVISPTDELVGRFAEWALPLEQKLRTNELDSRSLAAQRDALLPRLVSGELRV